ncbi:MAG: hypothetical protein FWD17_06705 [Polyangiaceae bacterium]|nr:hypothetical protein [Polyangiaceae bacterium]
MVPASVVGVVIALPALAEESPSTYPAPCDPVTVSKAEIERAHSVYLSGKQYLEESNYDKAISYFNDAYAIDCARHAILPIIATAYERKGDKGDAIRALDEYQRRAPGAPDHETIDRRIHNLKDQIAREGPPASASPPLAAPPVAVSSGQTPTAPPVEPTPGAGAAPTRPSSAAPLEPHHGVAPWALVGAGGAVLAAGLAILSTGFAEVANASSSCPLRSGCSADIVSKGNTGRTLVTVGYGVGAGGAALLGAGLIWHFLEASGTAPPAAAHAMPVITPGFAGVAMTGFL